MKIISSIKQTIAKGWRYFFKLSLIKKLLIAVVLIGAGWLIFSQIAKKGGEQPEYQTAQAEKGTLITTVSASGTISQGSSTSITSNASGIVAEVYVQNGDIVSVGESIALVTLDKNSQQQQTQAWASYLSAQNNLNSAKAKLNSLQSALFKANQTFVNGAGTDNPNTSDPTYIIQRADWLQAEADYNNQQNVIKQAEAALSSAWLSYSLLSPTITAPMSGIVSNISITKGSVIAGSNQSSTSSNGSSTSSNSGSSSTIGTVTLENGSMQATVNLTEIDVVKVQSGQKVTMTLDAFPDKTFTGKIASINTAGSVSSGVTTYPATIIFDTAPDTILPNMAVNAIIITDVKDSVILVPSGAIQTTNGESVVRVLKNGQVTQVSVEVGSSNDTQTEILSGINEGDIVITGQTTPMSGSTGSTSPFSGGLGGRGGGFGGSGGGMIIRR